MSVKYRINCMSSERGWGQEHWNEDFDTYEEARKRIYEINSKNTSHEAPDYYEKADLKVEAIDTSLVQQRH
jgi:small-conductance mechanosensitive channel